MLDEGDPTAIRETALAGLRTVTRNGDNVVPAVVDAVKTYATVGVFEDEFGSYQETISVT